MLDMITGTLNFINVLFTAVLDNGKVMPENLPPGYLLVGNTAVPHPLHVHSGQVSCTRL